MADGHIQTDGTTDGTTDDTTNDNDINSYIIHDTCPRTEQQTQSRFTGRRYQTEQYRHSRDSHGAR